MTIFHHKLLTSEGRLWQYLFTSNDQTKRHPKSYHSEITYHMRLRVGLHYGGEGLQSAKNAWPRHGYMREMVDVPENN